MTTLSPVVRELLARMAESSGDVAEAQRNAMEILERDPRSVPALLLLSRVHKRERRYDAALELLDRAVTVRAGAGSSPPRGLNLDRGLLLLNLGRGSEAGCGSAVGSEGLP